MTEEFRGPRTSAGTLKPRILSETGGLGFRGLKRVQGLRYRVEGLGFRVWGLGLRVQGSGFRVEKREQVLPGRGEKGGPAKAQGRRHRKKGSEKMRAAGRV